MTTATRLYPFYGTHEGGKHHVMVPIALVPDCGIAGAIDQSQRIDVDPHGRVHPIVCKRCLAKLKKNLSN